VEGNRIVPIGHEAILTRKRIMFNGSVVVTAVVDRDGKLAADLKVTAMGLLDETSDLDAKHVDDVVREIKESLRNLPKEVRRDDDVLAESIRVTTRRFFNDRFDRKPQTRVHLVRL